MHIGIFTKTFVRPSLTATFDAVVAHSIKHIQFNFASTEAHMPSLPDEIEPSLLAHIQHEINAHNLNAVALSGTFNMIHPNISERMRDFQRFETLALAAHTLQIGLISLCTGTRDPDNMWRAHPDNNTSATWLDLLQSMEKALSIAENADVTLGIEPETANVIASAQQARRLLNELRSPRLKIIIDPANLFTVETLPHMHDVLDEAFALLNPDIVLAHAKDVRLDDDGTLHHCAAGTGSLDYPHYLSLLAPLGVPLLLHGLDESQVTPALHFLQRSLRSDNDYTSSANVKI